MWYVDFNLINKVFHYIIYLAAVEACLLHGLKRRAVGLFKTSTTMALLQKLAKTCPPAAEVVKIINDDNQQYDESISLLSFSRYKRRKIYVLFKTNNCFCFVSQKKIIKYENTTINMSR